MIHLHFKSEKLVKSLIHLLNVDIIFKYVVDVINPIVITKT